MLEEQYYVRSILVVANLVQNYTKSMMFADYTIQSICSQNHMPGETLQVPYALLL
jgi:hypothetical protein